MLTELSKDKGIKTMLNHGWRRWHGKKEYRFTAEDTEDHRENQDQTVTAIYRCRYTPLPFEREATR